MIRRRNDENGANSRNVLLINVSPFTVYSSLLVPRLELHKHQVLDEYAVRLAIEVVMLSRNPLLKVSLMEVNL